MFRNRAASVFNPFLMPVVLMLALSLTTAGVAQEEAAEGLTWPRDIEVPEGHIVIYQPQLETFSGDRMTARAAVSVTPKGADEPVFGAVWFAARVSTNRHERTVALLDIAVSDARFPHATPDQLKKLSNILTAEIMKWDPTISLDRVLTALELAETERAAAGGLDTKPPRMLFVTHPAVLVTIDGEPLLSPVEGSSVMRVVNSPFLILFDSTAMTYYITDGAAWLAASEIKGPWQTATEVPAAVQSIAAGKLDVSAGATDLKSAKMPQIIVATEPTELIVTDGEPDFSSIAGTSLLFVANTDSDVFLEIASQRTFVLVAGRWYAAESTRGPWSYVPSGELPEAFAKIPPGSAKGHALASVAGTVQAVDAVHETYIPQTAAIDRNKAVVTVTYDGEPEFDQIQDTEMAYAVNTSYSVIRVEKTYYCCHEGVWFVAADPRGPWTVCVSVPQVIYTVPPSCPVYNVKYVYVYDSTPDVVYVGYTPGYVGCYVYGGTIVYGTGYVYRGWYGTVYYARPATWGFAFRYNPYTGGWGVRVGYGGFHGGVVAGYRRGGWWGAGGYRGYGDIDIDRTVTTPRGTFSGSIDVDRDWDGDIDIDRNVRFEPNENIYNRRENMERNVEDLRSARETRREEIGSGERRGELGDRRGQRGPNDRARRENNVFADRDGNIHRRTSEGWQRREKDGWSRPQAPSQRPSSERRSVDRRSSRDRSAYDRSRRSLEGDHQARQRGASRTSSYNRSRASRSGGSRSGASRSRGSRGGGRRR
ncbi:MAG: carbohydrate-binding family V/XII [Planctomycetota bacterium]|jgi:hypothetical protein